MPTLTFQLAGQIQTPTGKTVQLPPQAALLQRGPVVHVSITAEESVSKALAQQGQTPPPPKTGWGLIDTGASNTCVDDQLAQDLRLPVIDVVTVSSASHESTQQNVYPVQIAIPGLRLNLQAPKAIGAALAAQGLAVLIGRDVLQRCIFIYNGPAGSITIAI